MSKKNETEKKTLRDEIAIAALREIMASAHKRYRTKSGELANSITEFAEVAYNMADAMLAARNNGDAI